MALLDSLARSLGLTRPAETSGIVSPWASREHLQAATWAHLLDLPENLLPVDRALALTLPTVARGRNLIAGTIARFPLTAMRGSERLAQQPYVTRQPEAARPMFQTMLWTVDALLFYGRAWWTVTERSADGRASRFMFVPEWHATIDDLGQLTHAYGQPVRPADVVRIDGPHDGILNTGGQTIRTALALNRAAATASDNPVPSFELHQTKGERLDADGIRTLLSEWMNARRKYGVAYTSENLETKAHGAAPEQLLIDGRRAADIELARMMGLSAWAVDATTSGSSITYATVQSRSRELIDYTLMPYVSAIEARLSLDDLLPRGQWCRAETTDLLRGDFTERMNAYKTALDAEIYTLDEIRDLERGIPLEGDTQE